MVLLNFYEQISSIFEELFVSGSTTSVQPVVHSQTDTTLGKAAILNILGSGVIKTIDALLSARARNLKTLHEAEEVPIEAKNFTLACKRWV